MRHWEMYWEVRWGKRMQPKKECNKQVISFQSIKLHTLELLAFMTA